MGRCDIILTTGGLGPTVDDPTRQAVANALGVDLVFHSESWEQIEAIMTRYGRKASENNRRQAWIPAGAEVIQNPVGTAPAFIANQSGRAIACLPGVPREMELLFLQGVQPYLRAHFHLTSAIQSRTLHTAGMGESQVDELIGDLELQSNPTVGLLASPGRVDIRIAAKAESQAEIDTMLSEAEAIIRGKLGNAIFGTDEQTLEEVTEAVLADQNQTAILILNGFGESLGLKMMKSEQLKVKYQPNPLVPEEIETKWQETQKLPANITSLATLFPVENRHHFDLLIKTPAGEKHICRTYAGPPQMAPAWAETISLDSIRRLII
ncbi:MAG: hypothetical protein JXR32_09740, partial [Anaerolineaceae bacterium]|nr:hypothetical protein [Anaerolineaceae bacterium]